MSHTAVKKKLSEIYDELFAHDGFGNFQVNIKILKRQQKEVVIDCGKQYRYVVDFKQPEKN
ncbi:MAG: hypothetical protein RPT11_05450 [Bermanella sp.]